MTDSEFPSQASRSSNCCQGSDHLPQTECKTIDLQDSPRKIPWIIGMIKCPSGDIPIVDTKLRFADRLGSWKARWGIRRMNYRIQPKLYAVGNPSETSPVFVTANYKMSFDCLRSELEGIDGWILVLDTKGINVWCAAGKGTFGTNELVRRIEIAGLKTIVSHRRLIVPQLGATGISAHLVRERSGFHISYGPVRARDVKAYLASGMEATPTMRRVTFTLFERLVLIPAEIVGNLKYMIFASACFFLLSGVGLGWYSMDRVVSYGVINAVFPLFAAIAGAILPAALLPWLPGRAFSMKGAFAGILPMIGTVLLASKHPEYFHSRLSIIGWLLLFPVATSFMGMNFTGCSTYTSLSGVKKEMRIAIPIQISCALIGLMLLIIGLFV